MSVAKKRFACIYVQNAIQVYGLDIILTQKSAAKCRKHNVFLMEDKTNYKMICSVVRYFRPRKGTTNKKMSEIYGIITVLVVIAAKDAQSSGWPQTGCILLIYSMMTLQM